MQSARDCSATKVGLSFQICDDKMTDLQSADREKELFGDEMQHDLSIAGLA